MESSSYTMSISDNSSGPADSWTNATVLPQTSWDSGTWSMQAWAINVTSGTGPTTVTMTASHVTNDLVCVVDNYIGGPNPFVRDGVAAVATGLSNTPSVQYTTGSAAGDLLWSFTAVGNGTRYSVASPFSLRETATLYLGSSDAGVPSGVSASTLCHLSPPPKFRPSGPCHQRTYYV